MTTTFMLCKTLISVNKKYLLADSIDREKFKPQCRLTKRQSFPEDRKSHMNEYKVPAELLKQKHHYPVSF